MKLHVAIGLILLLSACLWAVIIRMPGKSYHGPLPALTQRETRLRDELRRHVEKLAGEIGERNLFRYDALTAAVEYLEDELTAAGYEVRRQPFEVIPGVGGLAGEAAAGQARTIHNLEVEIPEIEILGARAPREIIVIGAHYDSAPGTPGANDNGTGSAAVLALARAFAGKTVGRTLRFVLFVNEEPPYFQTPAMGSLVYAKRCRERGEQVAGMLSLETMGYFSDDAGSQKYPFPIGLFYPTTGDFLGFVGDLSSRSLVHRVIGSFRTAAKFPSQGASPPRFITGVDWSDHWSFWQAGYQGIMVTDTAPFRYEHYHALDDTPDKIDYDRLARVVAGLEAVVGELASGE